jgi:hypothetical protein
MGPAPSLSTYEAQATAEYTPQEQADLTTASATHAANLNTLNTQMSAINPTYDNEEDQLKSTVQQEAGQIAQSYSEHLLGNFSGLQGNDMGEMFSNANLQEQSIETQRTNAINSVNTSITNENLGYSAEQQSISDKYTGEIQAAADSSYNAAEKDYSTEVYQQEELQLSYAKLNQTAAYQSAELGLKEQQYQTTAQNNYLSQFKAAEKTGGVGFKYTGPNGEAIDLGQYSMALSGGNTNNALAIVTNQLAQSQTSYDKQALSFIGKQQKAGKNSQQILSAVQSKYGLDFSGTM